MAGPASLVNLSTATPHWRSKGNQPLKPGPSQPVSVLASSRTEPGYTVRHGATGRTKFLLSRLLEELLNVIKIFSGST